MVDIIVYQSHHVVRIALAVAIDSSRGVCCVIGWVGISPFVWQKDYKQYGGSSGSRYSYTPNSMIGLAVLIQATLHIGIMYLFYQFVGIHILFNLRSFSLMRPMRVVTFV